MHDIPQDIQDAIVKFYKSNVTCHSIARFYSLSILQVYSILQSHGILSICLPSYHSPSTYPRLSLLTIDTDRLRNDIIHRSVSYKELAHRYGITERFVYIIARKISGPTRRSRCVSRGIQKAKQSPFRSLPHDEIRKAWLSGVKKSEICRKFNISKDRFNAYIRRFRKLDPESFPLRPPYFSILAIKRRNSGARCADSMHGTSCAADSNKQSS